MSRLLAGRYQTSQEESAGGLALIISVILSGEGWEGGGFGSMTESGAFLGPVWFSVSGAKFGMKHYKLFTGQNNRGQ